MVLNDIRVAREKMKYLCDNKILIHIKFSLTRSKMNTKCYNGIVTGVYPNLFTVQLENSDGKKQQTFQYIDLLTGNVGIEELETANFCK